MQLRNHDPESHLSWYETLDAHPDPNISSVAEQLRDQCSKILRLDSPYPTIVWFREADFWVAREAFLLQTDRIGIEDNPFLPKQRFFRLHSTASHLTLGYTPCGSSKIIGINDNSDWKDSIVHELIHVAQDKIHGVTWRQENEEDAEKEAYSRTETILAELNACKDAST